MNVRGQNGLGKTLTLKAQSFRISYDKWHVPSITLIRDKNYTFLIKAFQMTYSTCIIQCKRSLILYSILSTSLDERSSSVNQNTYRFIGTHIKIQFTILHYLKYSEWNELEVGVIPCSFHQTAVHSPKLFKLICWINPNNITVTSVHISSSQPQNKRREKYFCMVTSYNFFSISCSSSIRWWYNTNTQIKWPAIELALYLSC